MATDSVERRFPPFRFASFRSAFVFCFVIWTSEKKRNKRATRKGKKVSAVMNGTFSLIQLLRNVVKKTIALSFSRIEFDFTEFYWVFCQELIEFYLILLGFALKFINEIETKWNIFWLLSFYSMFDSLLIEFEWTLPSFTGFSVAGANVQYHRVD